MSFSILNLFPIRDLTDEYTDKITPCSEKIGCVFRNILLKKIYRQFCEEKGGNYNNVANHKLEVSKS